MDTNIPAVTPEPAVADVPFDQLFASGEAEIITQPQADSNANTPQTTPETQPQAGEQVVPPTSQSFELKTQTGTVYKSAEEAVRGIEQKDALINSLRQYAIQSTGVDPITGQAFQQPQAPQYGYPQGGQQGYQQPQGYQPGYGQQQEVNYALNPQQYTADLQMAHQSGDPSLYAAVQQKFVNDQTAVAMQQQQMQMQQYFAPAIPLLQELSRTKAVDAAAQGVPEIRNFVASDAYRNTLQQYPDLAQAIATCENDFSMSAKLPGLYKIVYGLNQAQTLPELMRKQQTAVPQNQPTRPTTTPSSLTPPGATTMGNLKTDAAARKAYIDAFEKSGKADTPWK